MILSLLKKKLPNLKKIFNSGNKIIKTVKISINTEVLKIIVMFSIDLLKVIDLVNGEQLFGENGMELARHHLTQELDFKDNG